MKRLTLNYGARFEHFNASVPAESSPASTWIGARNFPAIPERAELERLGGPLRRRLRPVRQRQDGAQGQRRQVRRRAGGRLRADLQRHERRRRRRAPGTTLDGNGTILDAAGNIQINEVDRRHVQLRPGHRPAGSGPARAATTGSTAPSLQHELVPRAVGDRRLLSPRFLQPAGRSTTRTWRATDWTALLDHDADRPAAAALAASRSRCTR